MLIVLNTCQGAQQHKFYNLWLNVNLWLIPHSQRISQITTSHRQEANSKAIFCPVISIDLLVQTGILTTWCFCFLLVPSRENVVHTADCLLQTAILQDTCKIAVQLHIVISFDCVDDTLSFLLMDKNTKAQQQTIGTYLWYDPKCLLPWYFLI